MPLGSLVLLALFSACTRTELRAYPSGQLRLSGQMTRFGDSPAGEWTWWFPNGEPREHGSFADGRRAGLWTQWWPNGQKRNEGLRAWNRKTGLCEREGAWTFWHPNGVRKACGVFSAGQRVGRWEDSIEDGSLDGDTSGEYVDDKLVEGS